MKAQSRRNAIMEVLQKEEQPISASTLAKRYNVSRQIIVGDVALLRAGGADISATPKGYLLARDRGGIQRQIVCIHSGEQMGKELYICVDNGCCVLDVIVEHQVYGQLVGQLQVSSRYEVNNFWHWLLQDSVHALSELTDGIHIHTLRCPDEAAFQRVWEALDAEGFLVKNEEN